MPDAKRIAIIIDHLGAAGTQRQVAMLARELACKSREVHVIVLEPAASPDLPTLTPAVVHRCPVGSLSSWRALGGLWRLTRLLRQLQPDVVHTFLLKADLVGTIAARLAAVPVVVAARRSLGYDLTPRQARLLRLLGPFQDATVANDTTIIEHRTRREGKRPPCPVVIPNGVAVPPRPVHDILRFGRDIGMLANVRPVKGHDLMIAAMAELHRTHPEARLHLMGDWRQDRAWADHIRGLITKHGLDAAVIHHAPDTPLARFFTAIDVLAAPSRSEGLSNTILEALAHGVPVVATDVGGARQAMGNAGIAIPPDDPGQLAAALATMLDDDGKRQRLGRLGHRRMRDLYSPADLALRHAEHYDWLRRTAVRSQRPLVWRRPRRSLMMMIDILDTGGTEQQLLIWARELLRQGVPVEVTCLRAGGRVAQQIADLGVPVHVLSKRWRFDPWFLLKQQWLLARRGPGAVLALLTTAGIWSVPAARLAGVPRVLFSMRATTLTDSSGNDGPRHLLSKSLRLAHGIIGNSEQVLAYCRDELQVETRRLSLLPNAIDSGDLDQQPRAELRHALSLPTGQPLIGIVARLVPVKDHRLFLSAVRNLLRHAPGAHALIVGDGPEEARIASCIREAGLEDAVTMLGHSPDPLAVLRALDVAVLTSRSEGSPNAVLEALAVGTPVVSVDVGDVSSLLAHGGGRVLRSRAPEALARCILAEAHHPTARLVPAAEEARSPGGVVAELRRHLPGTSPHPPPLAVRSAS